MASAKHRGNLRLWVFGAALLSLLVVLLAPGLGNPGKALALGPDAIRAGFDAETLAANDDGSTGLEPIGFTVDYFGTSYTDLYVNNNGNVTFDDPLAIFTPFPLATSSVKIIAPFFADVDTSGPGSPVTYGAGTVGSQDAFGVNWEDVNCFASDTERDPGIRNYFQLILIDRSDIAAGDFDIEFNYDQIIWEAGEASDSDPDCLGGSAARAGFANDTGSALELPGSGGNGAFLDANLDTGLINNTLNSGGQLGRYLFRFRSGAPENTVNLGVVKTDSIDPVTLGDELTYTITVTNNAAALDTATSVTLVDNLPDGTSLVSATGDGSCSGVSTITCDLGSLAPGASGVITIVVDTDSVVGAAISNTVSVSSVEVDSNYSDNTDTEETAVTEGSPTPTPTPTDTPEPPTPTPDPTSVIPPVSGPGISGFGTLVLLLGFGGLFYLLRRRQAALR